MSNRLSNKLQIIRTELRREQISSLMTKLRYEAVSQQTRQQLSQLIETPVEMLTQQHLAVLLDYVHKDETNAILHLGNLIIERFITVEILEGIQWKLGNNDYWTWLINAMTELGYCSRDMMEYLIWRVIVKKSTLSLENALEALQRCLKHYQQFTMECLENREEFMLAIVNHIFDPNEKIFQLSMSMIVTTTSVSEDFPRKMLNVVGEGRLTRCFLHGLMKLGTQARNYSIQAANNFLMSDVLLPQVATRCVESAFIQKDVVKLQLSYYFRAIVKHYPKKELAPLIKDYDFSGVLRYYSSDRINHPKYGKQIRDNALIALRDLEERCESQKKSPRTRVNCRQGPQEAMRDQSETMCQQYLPKE